MSNRGTIHIDKRLTGFSLKYTNGMFIADTVCPVVPVPQDSGKYAIYGRQDFRQTDDSVANYADDGEGQPLKYTDGTYTCVKHSRKLPISDDDRQNADEINLELDTTEQLTAQADLNREIRVAGIMSATTVYGASNEETLETTEQWDNASFDPTTTVADAIQKRISVGKEAIRKGIGKYPTHIIIPAEVAQVVALDSQIKELVKYTMNNLLVNGDLPPTLWNMKVLIPGSIKDSADQGQTFSGSDVWGKNVIMLYLAPNPRTTKVMTAAMTFESLKRNITRWRDEPRTLDYLRIKDKRVEKVIGTACGYIIRSAIAGA